MPVSRTGLRFGSRSLVHAPAGRPQIAAISVEAAIVRGAAGLVRPAELRSVTKAQHRLDKCVGLTTGTKRCSCA